jgi:hypothetical protein
MSTRPGRKVSLSLIPVVALLVCTWLLVLKFHLPWGRSPLASQAIKAAPAAEIVVASLQSEDTAWVHRHLPDWSRSVYIVDDPSAELTVPKNKGREAMVYLRYVFKQTVLLKHPWGTHNPP